MDALVPGLSFDINLGALFSPLLLAVLLWALNKAKDDAADNRVEIATWAIAQSTSPWAIPHIV